jgi:hypothetical protein
MTCERERQKEDDSKDPSFRPPGIADLLTGNDSADGF